MGSRGRGQDLVVPLLMSSGSTVHFSPDLKVAMTACTVELANSRSCRKLRASARCCSPLPTVSKGAIHVTTTMVLVCPHTRSLPL